MNTEKIRRVNREEIDLPDTIETRKNREFCIPLSSRRGMHARPANAIVKVVKSLKEAEIETTITNTEFNVSVNGLNILDLMFIGLTDDETPLKFRYLPRQYGIGWTLKY